MRALAFRSVVTRPFDVTALISFRPPQSMERVREGAVALSDDAVMGQLLRAAMSETLLVAYRQRFLAAMPRMVNMRRESRRAVGDPVLSGALRRSTMAAYETLNKARVSGDPAVIAAAQTHLDGLKLQVRSALELKRRYGRHRLPHGMFRALALQVLDLMSNENEIQLLHGDGSITAGIGLRTALDAIHTPSATPELTGHPTSSTRNILWRQLEFGSGMFSTRKQDQRGRFRSASGGWWYGRSPDAALHLLGSRPGGMLRDPERQLPYDKDSVRFRTVFARLLGAALLG